MNLRQAVFNTASCACRYCIPTLSVISNVYHTVHSSQHKKLSTTKMHRLHYFTSVINLVYDNNHPEENIHL